MRRRLFNLLAALSLVLCLATVALWVRSYYRYDLWASKTPWVGRYCAADTEEGIVRIMYVPHDPDPRSLFKPITEWDWHSFSWTAGPIAFVEAMHGDRPRWYYSGPGAFGYRLGLPWWFVSLVLFILPLSWLWMKFRRPTTRPGHCPTCGYDLRATPERCPECGTTAGSATASS